MRRAAVQAFRSARRPCLRKFARSRFAVSSTAHSHGLGFRTLAFRRPSTTVLTSSMQLRAFQGALVAAAVAAGAFYASGGTRSFGTSTSLAADQSPTAGSVETAEVTRRALVVDNEQLFTGTITGNGPVSKETDDQGRKVLEMLTPEQATHKLRKNEESWIIGRGQGVVRYDVVQGRFLPSSSSPPFRMFGAGTPVISGNMEWHLFPPEVLDFIPSRPHHQDGHHGHLGSDRRAGLHCLACLALSLRYTHERQTSCLRRRSFHS